MTPQTPLETPLDQSPFLDRMVLFLTPYFLNITEDFELARTEILETLASYGARTRSEMLNAVRIIAFSFSTLDVLAEAKATEMSPSMRLRFRGCANTLDRACQQNEKTLSNRLACDLPQAPGPAADLIDEAEEARVIEEVRKVQAKVAALRNGLSAGSPAIAPHAIPAPLADPNERPWGSAMLGALAARGLSAPPA